MSSANRSNEPMAFAGRDAATRLSGYAPGVVATLPIERPVLALGAELTNAITLVVAGEAILGQHLAGLQHYESLCAFDRAIRNLISKYEVEWEQLLVVHDAHPEFRSTLESLELPAAAHLPIQHHRAHIASVLAERAAWDTPVVGVCLDGTGYGDDGAIWGGEFFAGSVRDGFERVAHLRRATLVGGDAAARLPVQGAAGFLAQIGELPDLAASPFCFPQGYCDALELMARDVRTFPTTSMGRLFDAAAALLGFTREVTFEGQAAMWIEQLAHAAAVVEPYPFPFADDQLDFRPLLLAIAADRQRGRSTAEIARAFQGGVARGVSGAAALLSHRRQIDTVVLSGGVWQNELLSRDVAALLADAGLRVWTNHIVPANDGGISLGQAALAAFSAEC